jgi:hypothetical protein
MNMFKAVILVVLVAIVATAIIMLTADMRCVPPCV